MGVSIKKITSAVQSAVSNPGNALKKAAVVVESAAVGGLTTGNPLGVIAGAAGGAIKASKTGKAPALNLRTAYQTAAVGAGSAIAANLAVAGTKSAIAAAKEGGLVAKVGTAAKGALAKAKGAGGLLATAKSFFGKAAGGGETTAGGGSTMIESTSGVAPSASALSLAGGATDAVSSLREKAAGGARSFVDKGLSRLGLNLGNTGAGNGSSPVIINTPGNGNPLVAQAGAAFDMGTMFLPALLIGALFIFSGKK